MNSSKTNNKKITLIAVVALALVATIFASLWAENFVAHNPTKVEPVVVYDEEGNEVVTEPLIGNTDYEPVNFSLECGFYSSEERLYLSAPDSVEIRYTTDGEDPSLEGRRYKPEEGIKLSLGKDEGIKSYSISACAEYADGSVSEVVTRSYFVGSDIANRFDCLVFSITIEPDYLYNYEDGIFILGKMRDDWLAANPDIRQSDIVPTDPANWNQRGKASERPAYVEVYEYDGNCVISQDCGLRIFGGWSRANDQKNLRLYARTEYDEVNNRFRYEFFPDATDSLGNKITSYKKLALRACANDNGSTFLRDDMISFLAQATEVEAKYSRPAAVFLNGEYYGFAWCQQVFSADLLEHNYNLEESEWDILKGCEYMIREDDDNPYWAEAKADWEYLQSFAYKDLTDDALFEELCQMIDLDNFLTYYAIDSYLGNGDWPNNNWKIFRYSTERNADLEQPVLTEAGADISDGRWRFMLFDTDFCLGLYGNDAFTKHIYWLFDETYFGLFPEDWDDDVHDQGEKYVRSDLLITLCKREDVRERFMSIMFDVINWHYNEELVGETIDEFHTWRLHELVAASENGKANVWSVAGELENMKEWLHTRTTAAVSQLKKAFPEYDDTYSVTVVPCDNALVNVNTVTLDSDDILYQGEYFNGIEVPVSCVIEDGYEFVSWTVNGEEILDREFALSDAYGDKVKIQLNVKCTENKLKLSEICYKGSNGDYIVIENFGTESVSTQGMIIWDGNSEAYALPTATIAPGRTLKLVCKNYSYADAIGNIECPFNLKEGETVTLYDGAGEIIDEIFLRDGTDGSALKLNNFTGEYYEITTHEKTRILEAELPSWNWGGWGGWGGW
ncbi:MAG: CotH kinase family protein [Oscillospiraceae bacterium]|nr:CotH kinase family protein [Oscillospiraceae bacterium]